MDNEYVSPAVIVVTLSFFLTVLEPCNYDKDLATKVWVRFVIFVHHVIQFIWFFVPLVYGHRFPKPVLYVLIAGLIYVVIQNVFLFDITTTQTCILSQYTNDVCMLPPSSPLRDIMYHLGWKSDVVNYNKLYNMYSLVYLLYLLYLVNK